MNVIYCLIILIFTFSAVSCAVKNDVIVLKGQWIKETSGAVMLDPQTSGLTFWRGNLLSISDGSADISQKNQLHIIDPLSGTLAANSLVMKMSDRVKNSCFSDYLSDKPDLEALAVDPNNDNVFLAVTEDATRSKPLSLACQKRFSHSGSTDFPSVLMRLELIDEYTVLITHVRPIQFDEAYHIGNAPNDGIEGLTFGLNNKLYLALEKDDKGKARIFSVELNQYFWQTDEFTQVQDTRVTLPTFESERHPINGLTYVPVDNHEGYLIAAARNDNQLWVIDLTKKTPTKIITLTFLAPTHDETKQCSEWEIIDNASIEGIAFNHGYLWLVNDPWKKHYTDNIQCETNRDSYQKFAPLLFSLPTFQHWFE